MKKRLAVPYYRTSSATNVGPDRDSEYRQRDAVLSYARAARLTVEREFYDGAVSGADPVDRRAGFVDMLEHCRAHEVGTILVESAHRFARDLMVQVTGHALLRERGIELLAVDAPTHFTDLGPTRPEFEKTSLVAKLRYARDRIRSETGRCEGRKTFAEARRLARKNPKTGKKRSLRKIAAELALLGYRGPTGAPYHPGSIARMVG